MNDYSMGWRYINTRVVQYPEAKTGLGWQNCVHLLGDLRYTYQFMYPLFVDAAGIEPCSHTYWSSSVVSLGKKPDK